MKNLFRVFAVIFLLQLTSCTTVSSGYESPIVAWGGETDMKETLKEGMHWGLKYLVDDTPEYEVREQTLAITDTYFDSNDMKTPVTVTIYFNPIKGKTNYLHKEIGPDYIEVKLKPITQGALAKVIPQYSAQDLNKFKRDEAEVKLKEILSKEANGIYVDITRIQFTKVVIPSAVAQIAEQTAVQLGKNELAEKMEAEKISLAKAIVAEAEGNYNASIFDEKTKNLMSQPKLLSLYQAETDRIWAEKGVSPYGSNNVFGGNPSLLLSR